MTKMTRTREKYYWPIELCCPCIQGRRHGIESGGQILRAKRAENFFDPHFLASGGQNIAQIAKSA